MSRESDLEAVILADRDAVAPYLVYGDWLSTQNDPRGEVIAFQHGMTRIAAPAKRARAQVELDALIARHAASLLGPLAAWSPMTIGRKMTDRAFRATWHFGFLDTLDLDFGWGTLKDKQLTGVQFLAELEAIFTHPSLRLLRSLRIGNIPKGAVTMQDVVELFARVGPTWLLELELGDGGSFEVSIETRTFDIACARLQRLLRLRLHAHELVVGTLDLPELVELDVYVGALTRPDYERLGASRLPRLETLCLRPGLVEGGASSDVSLFAAILGGTFARLHRLRIVACEWDGAIARRLATSVLGPRLTSLELVGGSLNDDDVRALAAAGTLRLERLDVRASRITAAVKPVLATLAREVETTLESAARAPRRRRRRLIGRDLGRSRVPALT